MSRRNTYPTHRAHPVRDRSITRRKLLAQEIRNELDSYKRFASDEGDEAVAYRDRILGRIDSKFAELLALEGHER